ncbi:acyltransferase family protein [Cryptosporangium japonicum]|uniref:acyltransferase family protein n=1 Tax=Cryptosporangium japonicum TaxID=80872 RepID=UPI0031E488B2
MSDRPTKRPNRELYLDALRTAAIIRVVTYHTFGGSWLSWAFPAMGVMFALAGGLMVRSLDKQPPLTVIKNRARRLLPALWLFGLVIIPVMLWGGGAFSTWTDPNTGEPVPFWKLIFWVVPIFDPPGNEFGTNFTVVLWYLRTYLWLVALSPLLLKAFRKWPIPTLVAPLGLVLLQAFGVLPSPDEGNLWDLVSTLGMFAPCWMLGFAHRTGKLTKIPMPALIAIVVACAVGGIAWALGHPAQDADAGEAYDLNGIPLANALWSIAVIIPLLRFAPDASWIGRTPFLGRLVALVNNRAVTIYLWHNVMIDASYPIDDWLTRWLPEGLVENPAWDFLTVWVLVALCVLAFGWVEDLAARRKPRLFPVGPSAAERRAEYAAELAAKEQEDAAPGRPAPVGPNVAHGDDRGRRPGPYGPDQYGQGQYGPGQYPPPDRYAQQQPSGYAPNGYGPPDAQRYQQYETGQYGAPMGGYDHPTADYNAEYRNANHPTADYSQAYREARGESPRRNGYPTQRPAAEGQPEEHRRSRH